MFRNKFLIFIIVLFPSILFGNQSQWDYWIKKGERLKNEKKYHEAKETTHKALKIAIKDFGNNHIYTGYTLLIYGIILGRLKEFDEGEQSLKKALVLYKNHFGKENKNVANILGAMANVNYMRGDYIKSEELSKKALEMADKVKLDNPIDMINILGILANSYRENGKYDKAENVFKNLIEIEKKIHGENHSEVLTTLSNLGVVYLEQERFNNAKKIFERVLEIRKRKLNPNNLKIAKSLRNIAVASLGQKQYQMAKIYFNKSLSIQKKKYGSQSPKLISTLFEIAKFYYETKKYLKSFKYCAKILKLMNKEKSIHPQKGDLLTLVGYIYFYAGRYKLAIKALRKANEIYTKKIKDKYSKYVDNVVIISESYENQGKYKDSGKNYAKELVFLKRKFGKFHPVMLTISKGMLKLYEKMNDSEMVELYKKVIKKLRSVISKKSSWNNHENGHIKFSWLSKRYREKIAA